LVSLNFGASCCIPHWISFSERSSAQFIALGEQLHWKKKEIGA